MRIIIKFEISDEEKNYFKECLKEEYSFKISTKQSIDIWKYGLLKMGESFLVEPKYISEYHGLFKDFNSLKDFLKI